MLLVADVAEKRRRQMSDAEKALFGIEKLNVAALRHSGSHPRGLFGAHPDRPPRNQSALPRADLTVQGAHRLPGLVNTSFNVRGEPIVCTPEDAFRCFMGTDIDCLAVGDCFLQKEEQDPALKLDYKDAFELD